MPKITAFECDNENCKKLFGEGSAGSIVIEGDVFVVLYRGEDDCDGVDIGQSFCCVECFLQYLKNKFERCVKKHQAANRKKAPGKNVYLGDQKAKEKKT